jgi:predicted RNA-binding Zn ribbon-like protein
METPTHIARNRIVGGDLALDFLNTLDGPPDGPVESDALMAYDDLVLWVRHVGELDDREATELIAAGRRDPVGAAAVLDRATALRSGLYAVFSSAARGAAPSSAGLSALRDAEADALAHAQLVPDGEHLAWSWDFDRDLARPLRPIAHAAIELLTGARLERVKACGGCRYLFVDASKNGSRRWCAMEDCGTAAKSKTYVARRRARAAEAPKLS